MNFRLTILCWLNLLGILWSVPMRNCCCCCEKRNILLLLASKRELAVGEAGVSGRLLGSSGSEVVSRGNCENMKSFFFLIKINMKIC